MHSSSRTKASPLGLTVSFPQRSSVIYFSSEMILSHFFLTREKYLWSILVSYILFSLWVIYYCTLVMMDIGSLIRCKRVTLNDLEERVFVCLFDWFIFIWSRPSIPFQLASWTACNIAWLIRWWLKKEFSLHEIQENFLQSHAIVLTQINRLLNS